MKDKEAVSVFQNNRVIISIRKNWCKACGICIEFCPKHVLMANEEGKPEPIKIDDCINCGLCELRCPDFAILVRGIEVKDE